MFENLGRALMLLRELRGVSQVKIARAAGIGKSQLSKYENCKELPKLDSLEKVLKALNVGYFEFFYTLRFVDDRAALTSLDAQTSALATRSADLGSILHPETQAAFQTVLEDYWRLYVRVLESVFLARSVPGERPLWPSA